MTKQGIIDKTRAIMNEIGEEENLSLLSEDTVKLAEYIESVIPDAINLIAQDENVSIALLNTGNMTSGGTSSEGCTVIPLPQDFLRFVVSTSFGMEKRGSENFSIWK